MNGLKSMDVRHVNGFLCRKGKLQILSNTQSNTHNQIRIDNPLKDTAVSISVLSDICNANGLQSSYRPRKRPKWASFQGIASLKSENLN